MKLIKNIEQIILDKSGWNEKQKNYYGVLIHNITDLNENPLADIISRYNESGVSVEWFIPNKEGEKISLTYLRSTNSLDVNKTDSEIKSQSDVIAFLDNIERIIKYSKPDFFPKSKIENVKKTTLGI